MPAIRADAVRRRDEPGQEPHRRRLARTVGPEEGDDLSLGDRERDVPDGQKRPELLAEPIGLDHDGRGHTGAILHCIQ